MVGELHRFKLLSHFPSFNLLNLLLDEGDSNLYQILDDCNHHDSLDLCPQFISTSIILRDLPFTIFILPDTSFVDSLEESNVEDSIERIDELEGESLDDQTLLVTCLGLVVLVVGQVVRKG